MSRSDASAPAALAAATGVPPATLSRLLRAGVAVGLFSECDSGMYKLLPAGAVLRSDDASGTYDAIAFATHPATMAAWSRVADAACGGARGGFDAAHGGTLWEHFASEPEQRACYVGAERLAAAPSNASAAAAVVKRLGLSKNSVVVDVGGGSGALLHAMLGVEPGLHCVNFDLPEVVEAQAGGGRVTHVGGSFFVGPIPAYDTAVMRRVLREWSDPQCVAILQTVGWEMRLGSTLVVLESLIPGAAEGGAASAVGASVALADVGAMALGQGRERSLEEFEALFGRVGMALQDVARVCEEGNLHAMFVKKQ